MRNVVMLDKADWDRLPVPLGQMLAEQLTRDGYAICDCDGKPTDRAADYLVGSLVILLGELTATKS